MNELTGTAISLFNASILFYMPGNFYTEIKKLQSHTEGNTEQTAHTCVLCLIQNILYIH